MESNEKAGIRDEFCDEINTNKLHIMTKRRHRPMSALLNPD
jgi:hypothetical protein